MGLRRSGVSIMVKLLVTIILTFIPRIGYSGWSEPIEVVSGVWGTTNEQFGFRSAEIRDHFPEDFCVLADGKIVIDDSEQNKLKVFNNNGLFSKSLNIYSYLLFPFGDQSIVTFDVKSQSIQYLGRININSGAWEWRDIERAYVIDDSKIEITNENIYINFKGKYYKYSPTGTLTQTYTTRPVELGVRTFKCKQGIPTESKCNRPHYDVEYPDSVYVFEINKENMKGDFNWQVKINNNLLMDNQGGTVYAYDVTSTIPGKEGAKERRLLGFKSSWKVPSDNKIFHPDPDNHTTGGEYEIIAQYGKDAVIGPDGSIYTWMRSETNYKIFKWTWQN